MASAHYRGTPVYKAPRTATTGRLSVAGREHLEARWAEAVADPGAWRDRQLADAARATNRAPEAVLTMWGLA